MRVRRRSTRSSDVKICGARPKMRGSKGVGGSVVADSDDARVRGLLAHRLLLRVDGHRDHQVVAYATRAGDDVPVADARGVAAQGEDVESSSRSNGRGTYDPAPRNAQGSRIDSAPHSRRKNAQVPPGHRLRRRRRPGCDAAQHSERRGSKWELAPRFSRPHSFGRERPQRRPLVPTGVKPLCSCTEPSGALRGRAEGRGPVVGRDDERCRCSPSRSRGPPVTALVGPHAPSTHRSSLSRRVFVFGSHRGVHPTAAPVRWRCRRVRTSPRGLPVAGCSRRCVRATCAAPPRGLAPRPSTDMVAPRGRPSGRSSTSRLRTNSPLLVRLTRLASPRSHPSALPTPRPNHHPSSSDSPACDFVYLPILSLSSLPFAASPVEDCSGRGSVV